MKKPKSDYFDLDNFLIFLLAGVVKPVSEMGAFWAGVAKALPAYNAMGLIVYDAFSGRSFDCHPYDFLEVCDDGDRVVNYWKHKGAPRDLTDRERQNLVDHG